MLSSFSFLIDHFSSKACAGGCTSFDEHPLNRCANVCVAHVRKKSLEYAS